MAKTLAERLRDCAQGVSLGADGMGWSPDPALLGRINGRAEVEQGSMSTWADEYITLLDDCEKREEHLTDWERGFIDSLRRQIEDGRRPSPKQIDAQASGPSSSHDCGPLDRANRLAATLAPPRRRSARLRHPGAAVAA